MHRPRRQPIRPAHPLRRVAVVVAVVGALLLAACSDDGGDEGGDGATSSSSATTREVDADAVLTALADDVIVPAYQVLGESLDALATTTADLCATPSPAALEAARDAWRDATVAWQRTRGFGVGPALDERLMSDVGFAARERVVTLLLEGTDPVDEASVAEEGAAARGLYAAEILLFGEGSDALATGDPRRCEYAASVAALAAEAAQPIVDAWVDGEARTAFVEGLDGGPQSSVDALVNEVSHRLDELDLMQLRDMAEAGSVDDLDETRLGGPADERLAERAALLTGMAAAIGDGETGISALVAGKDADTADRLAEATTAASDALGELPPSVADAFDDPDDIAAASDALANLKVLLSTEAASLLGVTISFSDSDGDS